MKKIVYLVAPLVAMPFLLGCNKVKTHKVQSVQTVDESLKFTTMKDKNLKGSAFNHKQNFKFKVEANTDVVGANYTVDPNGIGIYVGKDAVMPLLDGYSVEYTNTEKTEATVTVFANKATDDIYIRSIAAKTGSYIYSIPVMIDVRMPNGEETLGWHSIDSDFALEFEGISGKHPTKNCFLYTDDAETFHYDGEIENATWMEDHIGFVGGDTQHATVTIKKDKVNTGYFLIAARSGDKISFLDAFKWDEIKELTQNGFATYLFNIADEKTVNVKIGTVDVAHKVRIIGFNHDKENSITFQFATAISDATGGAIKRPWDSETSEDFENSDLNISLKSDLLPRLPGDLQNNIEMVTKYVGKHNETSGKWELGNYQAQLFPLALAEVLGDNEDISSTYAYAVEGEGTRYEYFKNITATSTSYGIRKVTDARGTTNIAYWLRSPNNYDSDTDVANYITSTGAVANQGAYVTRTSIGIAPAFVI